MTNFEEELTNLINRYSMENDSNTPDFILAGYIMDSYHAFVEAVNLREHWFNKE